MDLQIKSFDEYQRVYQKSVEKPEEFWAGVADHFYWRRKWNKVLDWNFKEPDIKWFEGGKLNITENMLDRHLNTIGHKPLSSLNPITRTVSAGQSPTGSCTRMSAGLPTYYRARESRKETGSVYTWP